MWVFLSRRLRRYAMFALAVPAVGVVLDQAGKVLERRSGPTPMSRRLRSARDFLGNYERGPIARRRRREAESRTLDV